MQNSITLCYKGPFMKKIVLFIILCIGLPVVGFSQTDMQGTEVNDNVHKESQFLHKINGQRDCQINWYEHNKYALLKLEPQNRMVAVYPLLQQNELLKLNSERYYGLLYTQSVALPVFHNNYGVFPMQWSRAYQLRW